MSDLDMIALENLEAELEALVEAEMDKKAYAYAKTAPVSTLTHTPKEFVAYMRAKQAASA